MKTNDQLLLNEKIDVITAADNYFKSQHLELPFIPSGMRNKLMQLQLDLFGTRETETIYDVNYFIAELLTGDVNNYVLFGFGGHGISSRAMHYYAVNEHLAVFYQLDFGNVFRDEEASADRVLGMFYTIPLIFNEIEKSSSAGLIPEGQRLLIVQSDFYGSGWGWIEGRQEKINEKAWHAYENVLFALASIPKIAGGR